jgi:osmotically-inducible protein OsmY
MNLTRRFQYAIAQSVIAASVLVSLSACAPTPTREGTGEYLDDSVITTKVKAAFAEDPVVKATQVKVETFKGTVQLSGFVDSRESAQRAVEIARGVKGVKSVKNDTVIR